VTAPIATVLNVDDYVPARYARTRVLKDAGFDVIEADSGEEALRLARTAHPDVVLLDYGLPDMTGAEVAREIKGMHDAVAVPVIQISAVARSVETRVEAMQLGADTYLTEPAPAELVAHVHAALRWRRAEQRLHDFNKRIAALYEEAQQANRIKDEFLSLVSHELRTPLNAMLGWIQLLRDGTLDPAQGAHALQTIERNTIAQVRVIEDLLDVSRIITGQLAVAPKEIDAAHVVRAAVDAIRPEAEAKGLRIDTNVPSSCACVNADPGRLRQVISNLLSNAVKFTDQGTIAVSLRCDSGRVRIEVRDTGVGIDPQFLPSVFDRFRQADSSKTRPHGGLGLGLAISRHIVEAHGGTISGLSAGLGRCATFAIELPESKSAAIEPAPDVKSTPAVAATPLEGVSVLVVEDDRDSREMMSLLLEHFGAAVTPVPHAAAALQAIADGRHFDVMLADVGLPRMDGYALMRELRSRGSRIPGVVLTGYASPADRRQAMEAGYAEHLGKPVMPDALLTALTRAVKRS
jgi:signal transduction histidine kinase